MTVCSHMLFNNSVTDNRVCAYMYIHFVVGYRTDYQSSGKFSPGVKFSHFHQQTLTGEFFPRIDESHICQVNHASSMTLLITLYASSATSQ